MTRNDIPWPTASSNMYNVSAQSGQELREKVVSCPTGVIILDPEPGGVCMSVQLTTVEGKHLPLNHYTELYKVSVGRLYGPMACLMETPWVFHSQAISENGSRRGGILT